MSRPVVVSDAGPLIALAGCGLLDLLPAVFDAVHIPHAVLEGVLLQAKRIDKIDLIAPALDQMQTKGYRVSQALIDATLKLAAEAA